jgi:hypothetical protein
MIVPGMLKYDPFPVFSESNMEQLTLAFDPKAFSSAAEYRFPCESPNTTIRCTGAGTAVNKHAPDKSGRPHVSVFCNNNVEAFPRVRASANDLWHTKCFEKSL